MAILDYDSVFDRLATIIRHWRWFEFLQAENSTPYKSIDAIENTIADVFETEAATAQLSNFSTACTNTARQLNDIKRTLLGVVDTVLVDVAPTLGAAANASDVISALAAAMLIDTPIHVRARLMAIHDNDILDPAAPLITTVEGLVNPDATNDGSGALIFSFKQAGDVADMRRCQTAFEEQVSVVCTGTSSTAGAETFEVSGLDSQDKNDYAVQGSGSGSNLTVMLEGGLLDDGDFEDWDSSTPSALSNWTLSGGTTPVWQTDVINEDTTVLHEAAALKFPAGLKDCILTQDVTLAPSTLYAMGIYIRQSDVDSTGTVTLAIVNDAGATQLDDAGDAMSLAITVDDLAAADTWYFKWVTFVTPRSVVNCTAFEITTASIATGDVYLDAAQLGAMAKHNGIGWAVAGGATDFGLYDRFGGGVSNGISIIPFLPGDADRTDNGSGTTTQFMLATDLTVEFPVGTYVQHPTDKTWHRITVSAFGAVTTVTVTPAAKTSFAGLVVRARYEGLIQKFIARHYGLQLPNNTAGAVTQEDPEY